MVMMRQAAVVVKVRHEQIMSGILRPRCKYPAYLEIQQRLAEISVCGKLRRHGFLLQKACAEIDIRHRLILVHPGSSA
ncbi:hypothetical protein WL67_27180 [Burkholderia ubonensis]|nr:hypothetical protein WJ45_32495 [Burkholderia ubonensis]KWD52132.1 hypothetical protein WL66_17615 [Burkholderia ubonensis]KWD69788.1 hypothetical protein WL67_27180 [Burkholderia ubonensis]